MKVTILLLGTLLSLTVHSQLANNVNHKNGIYSTDSSVNTHNKTVDNENYTAGIYKTDSDYLSHHLTLPFMNKDSHHYKMKDPLFRNEILIYTPDSTYKFYDDDIWGYEDKNVDYRLYDNKAYTIEYVGKKICIYTIPDITPENSSTIEYFSATLTSPIHYISRNNLIEVYHADTSFVNKVKHLPWTTSIDKWDHKHHNYKFVNWLN